MDADWQEQLPCLSVEGMHAYISDNSARLIILFRVSPSKETHRPLRPLQPLPPRLSDVENPEDRVSCKSLALIAPVPMSPPPSLRLVCFVMDTIVVAPYSFFCGIHFPSSSFFAMVSFLSFVFARSFCISSCTSVLCTTTSETEGTEGVKSGIVYCAA